MRIYVDFDHTISPNGLGPLKREPYANCVQAMKQFKQDGHTITIYSCRASREAVGDQMEQYVAEMLAYLKRHDIPYDKVHYGKPDYDVVIDDKAIRFNDNWEQCARIIQIDLNG